MSLLVFCRTCGKKISNSNGKNIFDKDDNEILEKIQMLTGIYYNADQHMPKQICGCCHLALNHSIAFRERCLKTHKRLLVLSEKQKQRHQEILDARKTEQILVPTSKIKSKKHPPLEIVRVSIEPHDPLKEQKTKQTIVVSKKHISQTTIPEEIPSINERKLIHPPNNKTHAFCEEVPQDENPNLEHSAYSDNEEESQEESQYLEPVSAESDNEIPYNTKNNAKRRVRKRPTGTKKYICDQCGRGFADSSNFKVHVLRHTGVKDFKCSECDSKYFTRHLLHLHIRVRHLGERPYACKYCDQRFFTSTARCRHEKVHHTRELSYVCRFCGKSYVTKSCLNKHEFLHTGERPYRCDICNVGFPRNTNLKLHYRSKQHQKRAGEVFDNPNNVIEDIAEEDEIEFSESNIEELNV
ncbi:transcription factor Ouib-like isoform X3 [Drosophila innubila]|uniref:transcription factor Ouib-like isoform X3 n=1 Tax=Drosophila innubila TaxID=198719 RepID=UPI00148E5302|nr:transcription factor Ouib-like isoform X3 [Drosophila innubila]